MEIFLNNQKIDFESAPEETLKDAVAALFQWLEGHEGKIHSFTVNDKPLDQVYDTLKDRTCSNIDQIKIEYIPPEWVADIWEHSDPSALLQETIVSLLNDEEKIRNFSVDIQLNKAENSYENISEFLRKLRKMVMTLERLMEENILNKNDFIAPDLSLGNYPQAVAFQLKNINSALKENDLILTGDLLEYEILPLIHSLNLFISGQEQ